MNAVTPTQLRSGLFAQIERALKGFPVHIRTRKGNAVLVSEKTFRKTAPAEPSQPIHGRIVGHLEDADKALQKHLDVPE